MVMQGMEWSCTAANCGDEHVLHIDRTVLRFSWSGCVFTFKAVLCWTRRAHRRKRRRVKNFELVTKLENFEAVFKTHGELQLTTFHETVAKSTLRY